VRVVTGTRESRGGGAHARTCKPQAAPLRHLEPPACLQHHGHAFMGLSSNDSLRGQPRDGYSLSATASLLVAICYQAVLLVMTCTDTHSRQRGDTSNRSTSRLHLDFCQRTRGQPAA
jgi:hypothetical protein